MNPAPTPRTDACEDPLVEQLRNVPVNAHEWVKGFPSGWRNVPYGAMCHRAADALAAKDAEIARKNDYLDADQKLLLKLQARVTELERLLEEARRYIPKGNPRDIATDLAKRIDAHLAAQKGSK